MAVFCSSLTSWCPGMSLTCFLNDFEIVPVAPITTGITLVFTFHVRFVSIVGSLYFKIFSASFLITFLSSEIATSINMQFPSSCLELYCLAYWPLEPEFAGSNPAEAVVFFGRPENPQYTFPK